MSTFKKFCDFCGGLALLVASLFLFREFMAFSPEGMPPLREKLSLFLDIEAASRNFRPHLGLIALLALTLLVGLLVRKLPFLGLTVATLPFLQALSMLRDGYLFEHPMLYLLLTALPIVGNLYDALHRDSLDGHHRAFVLANVSSLLVLGFCVLILWRLKVVGNTLDIYEYKRFDQTIFASAAQSDFAFLRQYAIVYAIGIAISLLFCGAYWLDLILASLPLAFALYRQLLGTLGPHSELLLALMILCFVCRLAITVAGTPWKQKKKVKAENKVMKNE